MRKKNKVIVVSLAVAGVMTITAGGFMSSSFSRIEESFDDLSDISEQVSTMRAIDSAQEELNAEFDAAIEDFMQMKQKADAVKPVSSRARTQKEELDYAIVCYANAVDAYDSKMNNLSLRKESLDKDMSGASSGGGMASSMDFSEKLGILFFGEIPDEGQSLDELRRMAEQSPERPDIKLLADMKEMIHGDESKEIENSKQYCSRVLAKVTNTIKNDAEVKKSSESNLKSGSSSGGKSSGSSSRSSGSDSKSSGSSSSYGGSYSGSSSRSSGSVSSPSGGSSSGGSSSGGSLSGGSLSGGSLSGGSSSGDSSSGGSSSGGSQPAPKPQGGTGKSAVSGNK